jgi:hypothetical protein
MTRPHELQHDSATRSCGSVATHRAPRLVAALALAAVLAALLPRAGLADVIITVSNPGAQVAGGTASTIFYSDLKITLTDGTMLPVIPITSPGKPYVALSSLAGNTAMTTVPGIDATDIRSTTFSVRRTATSTKDIPTGGLRGTTQQLTAFETPGLLDALGDLLFVIADGALYQTPPDIGTSLVFTNGASASEPDWTVYTSFDETTGIPSGLFTGSATVDFLLAVQTAQVPEPSAAHMLLAACGLFLLLRIRQVRYPPWTSNLSDS